MAKDVILLSAVPARGVAMIGIRYGRYDPHGRLPVVCARTFHLT